MAVPFSSRGLLPEPQCSDLDMGVFWDSYTVVIMHDPSSLPWLASYILLLVSPENLPSVSSKGGGVKINFLWAGLSENAFMLASFWLNECLIGVFSSAFLSGGI